MGLLDDIKEVKEALGLLERIKESKGLCKGVLMKQMEILEKQLEG